LLPPISELDVEPSPSEPIVDDVEDDPVPELGVVGFAGVVPARGTRDVEDRIAAEAPPVDIPLVEATVELPSEEPPDDPMLPPPRDELLLLLLLPPLELEPALEETEEPLPPLPLPLLRRPPSRPPPPREPRR
jgi:hypothetical protein